jgi:predicted permease
MEFEEMKKVWDTQANEPMYVINEAALRNSIARKKDKGLHITNISELLSIVVNLGAGAFLLSTAMFVLAAWMIIVGVYCLVGRIRRKVGEKKFDRTMLGDLDHAVSVANYQVRFSGLMRWNIIPVGILISWGLWNKDNVTVLMIAMILFFAITFYASGWEHNYYKERRKQVVELRNMLR